MVSISSQNSQIPFMGIKSSNSIKKLIMPAIAVFCLGTAPLQADTFEKENSIEQINNKQDIKNPTQLSEEDLKSAPSPIVTIANKERKVGIVVDIQSNRLYRYDNNGNVIDGYRVATGVLGKNGKSITQTGLRKVDHIENYPYKNAYGTKRKRYPKDYGPNILYLTIVNPKTGAIEGTNGEFIHGNNNPSSIGKYASHGCVRMDNEIIKQFAKEVKPGTLVLIK